MSWSYSNKVQGSVETFDIATVRSQGQNERMDRLGYYILNIERNNIKKAKKRKVSEDGADRIKYVNNNKSESWQKIQSRRPAAGNYVSDVTRPKVDWWTSRIPAKFSITGPRGCHAYQTLHNKCKNRDENREILPGWCYLCVLSPEERVIFKFWMMRESGILMINRSESH